MKKFKNGYCDVAAFENNVCVCIIYMYTYTHIKHIMPFICTFLKISYIHGFQNFLCQIYLYLLNFTYAIISKGERDIETTNLHFHSPTAHNIWCPQQVPPESRDRQCTNLELHDSDRTQVVGLSSAASQMCEQEDGL